MRSRSHRLRSWSASGTSSPARSEPRRPPRVGEQQQGQQPGGLRLPGEQRGQRAGQPDALVAQLPADQLRPAGRPVSLGEDQVDHAEHRAEPPGQLLAPRHAEPDAGLPDLPLGPHQPLRHRRLGHQEGGRDLRRGQPADAAQRQRDPRLRVQCRMAAHENQPELVILAQSDPQPPVTSVSLAPPAASLAGRRPFPPQPVQRLVPRRAGQPGAGIGRHPARPARSPARPGRRPAPRPRRPRDRRTSW